MPNASNSFHPHFCIWNVILNSLSARKIHVHNVSVVKTYVHTKGKQVYRRVRCSTQSRTLRVPTHQHSRVGSGRVGSNLTHRVRGSAHRRGRAQSDSKSQGKCTAPGSIPIWCTESGEVHTGRVESSLIHRVRGGAHRPGRVQTDSQSQGWCTPPGSSPIWLKESGEVYIAQIESNMTYKVTESANRPGRIQSDSQSGEVHIARVESNLTHRVRGIVHRPGRVQTNPR